jgi:hypothetical protein
MGKLEITQKDLSEIYQFSHLNFVNSSQKELTHNEFVVKCYLNAVVTFLNKNGLKIDVSYFNHRNVADKK